MNLPLRSRLRRDEGGWALVTSIILLAVMIASGLAFASIVDTQTGASREQRVRETAFNLAESALSAQVFQLSTPGNWPGPGKDAARYSECVAGATTLRCPTNEQLTQTFTSVDLGTGAGWRISVRDNNDDGLPEYYDDGLAADNPGYDFNGDGVVWVRAQATAKTKTRTLVALVRAEYQEEDIPRAAIVAGRMDFSNAGNKAIILGSGPVIARCNPLVAGPVCLGQPYDNGQPTERLVTQLGGSTPVSNPGMPSAMTPAARLRLKQTAIANGTFYATGCPPSLTGAVIYIAAGGECKYTGSGSYNSEAAPGLVIMETGSLEMYEDFFGVIYHANLANSTAELVRIQGNGLVKGGVLLDGPGLLTIGSSKENLLFDPNAFGAVKSLGSAAVIQNTWREIKSQ